MVNQTADRFFTKSGGWLNLYIIAASLAMAMLGLVMLFSAGAVKGAQSLLCKATYLVQYFDGCFPVCRVNGFDLVKESFLAALWTLRD